MPLAGQGPVFHLLSPRDTAILRVILVEGVANLGVLPIKLAVGLNSGSLAIIADALHSLTDILNNIVAWFVIRHSIKPADPGHPYGHRKFETVAVFALASLLVVLAFELAMHALTRAPSVITAGPAQLILMAGVLLTNIVIATWQRGWAVRLQSDILLADANHTFSDVLITLSVIAGWQMSARGWVGIDRMAALAVAVLILYLAYGLFKRTLPVLLDASAISAELLRKAIQKVPGVDEVRRVRSRWVGTQCVVDLVIGVNANLSMASAHLIADQVEEMLKTRFDVRDVSIHIEPSAS